MKFPLTHGECLCSSTEYERSVISSRADTFLKSIYSETLLSSLFPVRLLALGHLSISVPGLRHKEESHPGGDKGRHGKSITTNQSSVSWIILPQI